jgi:hypothetical protein
MATATILNFINPSKATTLMPCEVVLVRVYFFKMAAVAMEIAKMLQKIEKQKNDHRRLSLIKASPRNRADKNVWNNNNNKNN